MIRALVRRELGVLWASAVPYVVGATFQCVIGVLMVNQLQVRGQAVLQPLFPIAGFLLLLVVPVLTMRAIADETRTGTLDLLFLTPVGAGRVVFAKWLSAWLTTVMVLGPCAGFGVLVALWGDPDLGPMISGFTGLALLAATLSAIGVLASSLTDSQPIAAMVALFATVVAWFAHVGDEAAGDAGLLAALSLSERLRLFAGGAIDTGDAAFFLLVGAAALVLAADVVQLRRLR